MLEHWATARTNGSALRRNVRVGLERQGDELEPMPFENSAALLAHIAKGAKEIVPVPHSSFVACTARERVRQVFHTHTSHVGICDAGERKRQPRALAANENAPGDAPSSPSRTAIRGALKAFLRPEERLVRVPPAEATSAFISAHNE